MNALLKIFLCMAIAWTPAFAAEADSIFVGGTIVTINDIQPNAQAVAIADGKIIAVGERKKITKLHRGKNTKIVDLAGKTLVPGFIDPHSHFMNALAVVNQVNVSAPPVGPASRVSDIVTALQRFAVAKKIAPGELIIGYGYDENLLPADEPLTRDSLDPAFPDNPVLIMHVSLHGAVLNGAAMQKYGISAATKTPPGGIILRKAGTDEPSGLVMETAYLPIYSRLPAPTAEGEFEQLRLAQELYAAAGITTAHEGATHGAQFDLLKRAANAEKLFLDVVAYPFITDLDAVLRSNPAESFGKYNKHLKLGGCKIVLDGSVQGRTGFFTTPYLRGGPGGEADWYGSPSFMPEIFDRMIKKCYDLGLQVLVHANGDAAIDLAIKGHESAAADDLNKDRRTTIIHAQFVRKDQLEKFVRYRLIPSFFTQHAFFFSEAHLLNRGKAQTYGLSPMRSAMAMGLRPTNHTDFNVTPINQMFTLWTAVTRQSRTGEVIGPDERVSALDALKAITLNAAYQYGEEGRKGSIEVGKLADFVVLDANPLTVAPNAIKDIKVLQTIKEGRVVFPAK